MCFAIGFQYLRFVITEPRRFAGPEECVLAGEIVVVVKLHTSRLAEILVEIPEDFFLVLGIYKPSEPHAIELSDIILLVGAV